MVKCILVALQKVLFTLQCRQWKFCAVGDPRCRLHGDRLQKDS